MSLTLTFLGSGDAFGSDGRLQTGFGARRIVLTHRGPSMLERRSDSEFECASDGLVLSLDRID